MSPSCDIEDRRRAKHAVVPVGAHERNDSATLIDRRDGRDRSVIARIFPDERSKAAGRPHGQIVRLDNASPPCVERFAVRAYSYRVLGVHRRKAARNVVGLVARRMVAGRLRCAAGR